MPADFERYAQLDIHPSKAFFDVQFKASATAGNKLQVSLLCEDSDVQIHYNSHEKVPTIHDALFTVPVTINKSTNITAVTFNKDKMLGKSITKSFLVSKLTGLPYTKNLNNTWYDGGNVNALTDGIPGNTKVYSQWVGIGSSKDAEIIVDMQHVQKIELFSVGLLNAVAMCVLFPTEISLSGSQDGITYQPLAEKHLPVSTSPTWVMIRPELTFPSTEVRYIKLQLKSAGPCSLANPESLNDSMIFMDEIGAW